MPSPYAFGVPGAADNLTINNLTAASVNATSGTFTNIGIGTSAASGSVGTYSSAPSPASASVTASFGQVAVGTAQRNLTGFDIFVTVSIVVATATSATFVAGVGPTSTPATATIAASFSAAANVAYDFTFKVPQGYYLLINDTGTITLSSTTTWAQAA